MCDRRPLPRQALRADGFNSVAVVLKHAAIFPDNEAAVGRVARDLGFTQVGAAPRPRLRPSRVLCWAAPDVCMRR